MKKKILVFVHYYLPGFKSGGPLRTISNMVEHLSNEFEFKIFCLDRDALDNSSYPGIKVDSWNKVGEARVFYCSPNQMKYNFIKSFLQKTDYDVLYLNSFFSLETSIFPLLMRRLKQIPSKPLILAPRGQFSDGALKLKQLRKTIFIKIASLLNLWKGILWHASSDFEKDDIKRALGRFKKKIFNAIDLPAKNVKNFNMKTKKDNRLKIVFISRIDPKKNLHLALQLLKNIKEEQIVFDIYGPLRIPEYWEKCKKLIQKMPDNVQVSYKGCLEYDEVLSTFATYDLFFFPTLGENYGHVILESMLAGTPVLISDTTPWRNLEKEGVGWDLNLHDEDSFIEAIKKVYLMKPEEHFNWREKVRNWALKKQTNESDVEDNRQLFKYAIQEFNKGQIR